MAYIIDVYTIDEALLVIFSMNVAEVLRILSVKTYPKYSENCPLGLLFVVKRIRARGHIIVV